MTHSAPRLPSLSNRFLLLLAFLAIVGCQSSLNNPRTELPIHVRYRLAWSTDSIQRAADGSSWELVNNLGYRVRLTRGYVDSYLIQLVECPPPDPKTSGLWFPGPSAAYAGHASGTPNPAAIRPIQIESLLKPVDLDVGEVNLSPTAYCQLHYLVARASNEARGLPTDVDMSDSSLHIDGTYVAPGSSDPVPFNIHVPVAYGAMFDQDHLTSTPIRAATAQRAITVVVRRHLDKLFEGVDFAKMRPAVIANKTLQALIEHSEVEILAAAN